VSSVFACDWRDAAPLRHFPHADQLGNGHVLVIIGTRRGVRWRRVVARFLEPGRRFLQRRFDCGADLWVRDFAQELKQRQVAAAV